MSVVEKAVWMIETGLAAPPSLDDRARIAGVSRFHLSRVFAAEVGRPPMAYAGARRLSEAARALELGFSVTEAAFGAGFESPEGFSRAFRRNSASPLPRSAPAPGSARSPSPTPMQRRTGP